MEFNNVYIQTETGLVEYIGGANFINGVRTCPNCKGKMVRIPFGVPYHKIKGGKIIVDINPDKGYMILNKTTPDYIWGCTKCPLSLTRRKK